MFRKLIPLFGLFVLALPLHADDAVRSAQSALKGLGYYDGPVNGELSADLKGAVRRYQKRNGLPATGELTEETVTALGKGDGDATPPAAAPESAPAAPVEPAPAPDASAAPPVQPAPPAPERAAPRVRPEPSAEAEDLRAPATPAGPPPESARSGHVPPSAASDPAFAEIFAGTPYQSAPAVVQHSTLRRAQSVLAERGLMNGPVDGRPGAATEEAVFRYQAASHLRRTGRLDIDTLARLHLLPNVRHIPAPHSGAPPVYRAPVVHEPVYQGRPVVPQGAVRGIPVD